MDVRFKRSWTLIFHTAGMLRDFGFKLGDHNIEKLTIAQERVLQIVIQNSPKGVMLKDIAKEVGLTPGAVSQTIELFVRYGLVERTSDAHDRRAVNIHITKRMEELRDKVIGIFDNMMESVLEKRTVKEREAFIGIFEDIMKKFATSESTRRHVGETLLAMEEYK